MRSIFRFPKCFLLTAFLFVFANSLFANESWFEIDTPHFELVGNVEQKRLKNVASRLEDFHDHFQNSFKKIKFQIPFRSNVIVLKDANSLAKFPARSRNFVSADDANYILIYADSDQDLSQIFNEHSKFLMRNNLGNRSIPAWLNEGIAEYFSNAFAKNVLLTQPNNLIPVSNLLETDYYTLESQNPERKSIFVSESLAFLNFLINRNGSRNFEKIERFIQQLRIGRDYREALTTIFGLRFSTIDAEFGEFAKLQEAYVSSESLRNVAIDFRADSINESQGFAHLASYFYYVNRMKEAMQAIEKSLQIEPDNSLANSTLALIKAQEFYYEEAELLAENALQNEPNDYLNHFRYAKVLSRQGMTEYGFVSGYDRSLAAKMRTALLKSIELNSAFTESYALLAFVNYVRNEEIDNSLKLIKKALEIAPENQQYLLREAELNLRKENFTEARKSSLDVFRYTASERVRLYAQNTIQRIDTTEFQLDRIRNEKTKYVNDDIVTDKPLSDDEIKKLREKATAEQIRAVLRRPKSMETRVLGNLTKIECGKDKIDVFVKTDEGIIKLQAKSFDSVSLISFIEEMSYFKLNCGRISHENNASVIFENGSDSKSAGNIISVEFVPKGFKLKN